MTAGTQPRSVKDEPFCWQSKEALRRIHDAFSETDNLTSGFAVYLALTIIASDNQSDTFTERKALIAFKSGVSIRTAGEVLKRLEALKILRIERQSSTNGHPDGPSRYTLLKVGNGCTGVGNGCIPVGNQPDRSFIADKVEEYRKNLSEESEKKLPAGSSDSEFQPAESIVVPPPASPEAAGVEPKARKAKAKKAESPPDPRFKPVSDGYGAAYLAVYGKSYVHSGGKDGAHLKAFLGRANPEQYSAEDIVRTARAAMEHSGTSPYAKATKFASSLSTFCTQFPSIQAELNGAKAKTSGQTPRRYIN